MLLKRIITALTLFAVLAAGGCASMPDVTVNYYFPKAQTKLEVTQSLACSPDGTRLISAATVGQPTTTYVANTRGGNGTFNYHALSKNLADSDVTVSLNPDGTLSGVNATSSGAAGATIKNVLSFVTAVMITTASFDSNDGPAKADIAGACGLIRQYLTAKSAGANPAAPPPPAKGGGDNRQLMDAPAPAGNHANATAAGSGDDKATAKTITLSYRLTLNYDGSDGDTFAMVDESKSTIAAVDPNGDLRSHIPGLFAFTIGRADAPALQSTTGNSCSETSDAIPLRLNTFQAVPLVVLGPDSTFSKQVAMADFLVDVPTRVPTDLTGTYCIPVPKAAWFGKLTFALTLSPFGSVQKLQYSKTSGSSDLADAATSIAKSLHGPTAADQAADLKAKADLIVQQQRLAACEADPTTCK